MKVDRATDCILCRWVVRSQCRLLPSQCSPVQLQCFVVLSLVVEYLCYIMDGSESVRVVQSQCLLIPSQFSPIPFQCLIMPPMPRITSPRLLDPSCILLTLVYFAMCLVAISICGIARCSNIQSSVRILPASGIRAPDPSIANACLAISISFWGSGCSRSLAHECTKDGY